MAKGKFVVLCDAPDREGEADLVLSAKFATPKRMTFLREKAGGLLCLATDTPTARKLGLPYATELLSNSKYPALKKINSKKTAYGDAPAFSVWINHKSARTGVPDSDKSLAAKEFASIVSSEKYADFARKFVSPGHLPLLIGRKLSERKGHTEMALKLCEIAGLPPAVLVCEMLGGSKALPQSNAAAFAKRNRIPLVLESDF